MLVTKSMIGHLVEVHAIAVTRAGLLLTQTSGNRVKLLAAACQTKNQQRCTVMASDQYIRKLGFVE